MIRKFFLATLLALMLFVPSSMQAKVEHLLPRPQQVTVNGGEAFALLGRNVTINYSDGTAKCELLEEFFTSNGCVITTGGVAVNVSLVASIDGAHDYELHGYENEAYTLEITANEINITAVTATGIIRAAQTLTQLAEGYDGTAALEALTMKDWPAFKLRGYMHDVGRSFISADELVKQVELFSRFKVNTFHWHMTENQAWRFEVKAYPELTSDKSMTRFPGQYYTQEDCKKVLDAAKKHGMIVVPEIDMPGHSEAFERAMGFNMQSEEGKIVLKKVLDEVCAVFADAPYIHIGGDEVSTTAAYLNEMIAYVESKGKKAELWNPINGIGQDALNHTLAQMWGTRGYLAPGKANIDCRYNYTNHFDVFADLVGIYKSNIYYHEKGTPEVAGAVSGCWNDRKVADEVQIMAQNNVWANVIATAERAWIGGGKQYIDNMTNTPANLKVDGGHGGVMLPNSGEEFEEFASWERRFLFHKANSLKNEPIPYVKQTNVRWRITDAFPNNGNSAMSFAPETAGTSADANLIAESFVHEGKTYYTGMATGAGIYLSHTWGNTIIDAYYSNPQFNHTAYAWTFVYSDKEQTVGAQIEFQNYSRSEQDGAPATGKWDHFGSRIWLNGEEIPAPEYTNTGVSISSKEVMLKNENFPARKPIEVKLKKGWNKVFLKLPYMNTGYRLKKWMFTFVLTDVEGNNAVEGLIYSPNKRMDAAADQLAAVLAEVRNEVANSVGDQPGQCNKEYAAEVEDVIARIEATIDETMTENERAAQMAELNAALEAFKKSPVNFPLKVSSADEEFYYTMCTPQRGNRYPTSKGNDAELVGEATVTDAAKWKFVARADGKYDIVNKSDKTYISPASANNTALRTQSTSPANGWVLKSAATSGLYIVVSDDVQFNQTNSAQNYKVYNWGSGNNTTDTGCQYLITEADAVVEGVELSTPDDFANGEIYYFETSRGVLGATADNANLVSSARTSLNASVSNPFCQWTVYKSTNGKYYLYNIGKGMFMGATTTTNSSIPFTENPTNDALMFKSSTKDGYPIMFSCNANMGVVNHSTDQGTGALYWAEGWNKTNDDGSCHKVTKIGELNKETLDAIKRLVGDVVDAPESFLSIAELEDETCPYVIAAELAQDVFEKGNLTIAVDVTIAGNLSGRGAIVCAADPTHAITGATKNNSPYIGYGFNGKKPAYLPSSASGDVFTAEGENLAAGNYKVVYVVDKENQNLKTYVNAALMSSADYPLVGYELQSFSNFAANANAKLYIGGGMVNNNVAHDVFAGEIHSVHFFDEALDATAVAKIDYSIVTEGDEDTTVIDEVETENENAKAGIYDLSGRKVKEVVNPGVYIVNGAKKVIR